MKKILLISLLILWKVTLYGQETLEEVLNKYNHKKVPYIAVAELKNLQQKNKVAQSSPQADQQGFDF